MSTRRQRCEEAVPDVPVGQWYTVPNPLSGRSWVDDDGLAWKVRGGMLPPEQARRLLAQPDVRVMHVYDGKVHDHPRQDLADLETVWNGAAHPHADLC